jgi:phytoene dehydrogenase-like protein
MEKKIVIIGAGIAGLSAGCYARMNGYDVEIHEAHNLPGGLCTSWKRGNYVIDGCIHWLTDSSPGTGFYRIWEELGAVQGRQMFNHDIFSSVVGLDGRRLHFYTDVDRLEDHLRTLSSPDAGAIKDLCGLIRRLARFPSYRVGKAPELMGLWDNVRTMARMVPYLKDFSNAGDLTLGALGARFTDPLLRGAIANFLPDETMPAMALVLTLGPMSRRVAGYPLGGSLELARAIEQRFLSLGGRIVYRSRVEKVLERAGRAVGMRLADGDEVSADYVISASDMRATLFSLLDGSRVDPLHRSLLETGRLYAPIVQVTFGVNMDFSDHISCIGTSYELEQPIEIAGRRQAYFLLKNYCYDPSLAPPGKSVVGSGATTDWSYWEPLIGNRAAYDAEKKKIAAICRDQIEHRYPGFTSKIEMTDVATPHTFARYTGNWKGTYMTWMLSGDFQRKHRYVPKTVPGLSGFYLASMWTNPPGGISGAASVGREVVQLLCHDDRKRFVTSTA